MILLYAVGFYFCCLLFLVLLLFYLLFFLSLLFRWSVLMVCCIFCWIPSVFDSSFFLRVALCPHTSPHPRFHPCLCSGCKRCCVSFFRVLRVWCPWVGCSNPDGTGVVGFVGFVSWVSIVYGVHSTLVFCSLWVGCSLCGILWVSCFFLWVGICILVRGCSHNHMDGGVYPASSRLSYCLLSVDWLLAVGCCLLLGVCLLGWCPWCCLWVFLARSSPRCWLLSLFWLLCVLFCGVFAVGVLVSGIDLMEISHGPFWWRNRQLFP